MSLPEVCPYAKAMQIALHPEKVFVDGTEFAVKHQKWFTLTDLAACTLWGTCERQGWEVHWRNCPDYKKAEAEKAMQVGK